MALLPITLQEATVTAVILLAIALSTLCVYRKHFHALSAFPGPWVNSLSSIPGALALVRGRQHIYYHALHEKYGPVVRVSPDELSFASADAWEDIYGLRNGKEMGKSPLYASVAKARSGAFSIGQATGREHARLKKELARGFTKTALRDHHDLISGHIDKMLETFRISSSHGRPALVSQSYTYLSFDCTGEVCFAEPDGCLDPQGDTEWPTSVTSVVKAGTWEQAIRKIAGIDTWPCKMLMKLLPSQNLRWKELHFGKTKEKTLKRLAKPETGHRDIVHYLLKDKDKGTALSPMETILNMSALIAAGTLTTSVLLTAWTYIMCTHPDEYKRLAAEVRGSFTRGEQIDSTRLIGLPYLAATIDETLRLFPPAAISLQRDSPQTGATVDSWHVPGSTTVSVSPWAAARSARNFIDPDRFRPERWMSSGADKYSNDDLCASQPFSLGSRVCIGQELALLEAKLTITRLLLDFDMELESEGREGESNASWTLNSFPEAIKAAQIMLLPDLWVRFHARELEFMDDF